MIQALVDRYNLTLEQTPRANKHKVVFLEIPITTKRRALWEFRLADVLSRGFNCKVLRNNKYVIVGRALEANTVVGLFAHIKALLERRATYHTKMHAGYYSDHGIDPRTLTGDQSLAAYRNSVLNGAIDAIESRLQERLANNAPDSSTITALVIVRSEEINEAVQDRYGKIRSTALDTRTVNSEARALGWSEGSAIALTDKTITDQ
jgi:hypothetical protein